LPWGQSLTPLLKTDTLKLVYSPYFHSIMPYGVIFWEVQQTAKKEYLTAKRKSLE
jgi:hypothetical protein